MVSGVSEPVITAPTTSSTVRGRSAPGSSAAEGVPALSSGGTGAVDSSDVVVVVVAAGTDTLVVGAVESSPPHPTTSAPAQTARIAMVLRSIAPRLPIAARLELDRPEHLRRDARGDVAGRDVLGEHGVGAD